MAEVASQSGGKSVNRLASQLSLNERASLLEKLKTQQSPEDLQPMYEKSEAALHTENIAEEYAHLPWLTRVYFMIRSAFDRAPPTKLYEEKRFQKLGKQISSSYPGVYDYKEQILLSGFYTRVSELKDATRFFFSALDTGFKDKNSLFVFMASLIMGEVHARLQNTAMPEVVLKANPKIPLPDLKTLALKEIDETINRIPNERKAIMSRNVRSLYNLKDLSSFSYDRMLTSFSTAKHNKQTCMAVKVRDMMVTLCGILMSLQEPPPLSVFESLFIFQLQDKNKDSSPDMEQGMKELLAKAEEGIAVIRTFNHKVPLAKIICCVFKNLSYVPKPPKNDEDWLASYREYWKRLAESNFMGYIHQQKRAEVIELFKTVLKGASVPDLEYVYSAANTKGFPLNEDLTLAFLRAFHTVGKFEKSEIFQSILYNGDFNSKAAQSKFTDSYNAIARITEVIDGFDVKISSAGTYGSRYFVQQAEAAASPSNRKKMLAIQEEASHEAKDIITNITGGVMEIVELFNNSLRKNRNEKLDTVNNLDRLAINSKAKEAYIRGITDISSQFQQVLHVLEELENIRKAKK